MTNFHSIAVAQTPDGPMPIYIASPEGHGPHPAVLVIQGMHGANSYEFSVAERLSNAGFIGAVPDMFHRGPACFSDDELQRHGLLHETHIYPGVGHGFMSARGARANSEVQEDAWSRLMGWFNKYLVAEPVAAR